MMNSKNLLFIFVLFSSAQLLCDQPCQPRPARIANQPLVEVKAGYFFFRSGKMRKIFDQGGIDVQISGTYPVYKRALSIYGSAEYLQKSGHSLGEGQKTRVWEWPLSLGLRLEPRIAHCTKWYFTVGPRYFIVRAHNFSSFVPEHIHKSCFGLFANTGFLFLIAQHYTIDFFGEYSYGRLSYHSSKPNTYGERVQVGGFTVGGGFGYSF